MCSATPPRPIPTLDNNATTILSSNGWDDTTVVFNLPAGFNFKYHGTPVTQWRMDTHGGLYPNDLDFGLQAPFIMGIKSDYLDNGNSKISFDVSGTTGSRIAKVEFRNLGFYGGNATDTANFQIWLYEGSHKIEYHCHGPSHTRSGLLNPFNNGDNGVLTGLMFDVNIADTALAHVVKHKNGIYTDTSFLVDPANLEDQLDAVVYDTVYPVNGAVFAFAPKSGTSVKELITRISSVSPNPAGDKVTLQLKNRPPADAQVVVYTLTGQSVLRRSITETLTDIALDGLSKGIYMLSYNGAGARETLRIVKK